MLHDKLLLHNILRFRNTESPFTTASIAYDSGGERAAATYSLVETAKLNNVSPQAWLASLTPYQQN